MKERGEQRALGSSSLGGAKASRGGLGARGLFGLGRRRGQGGVKERIGIIEGLGRR